MKTCIILLAAVLAIPGVTFAEAVADDSTTADPGLLKRMYALRMRMNQERLNAENEARANVSLAVQMDPLARDNPTVSQLRQQTSLQLARFEQNFRCLDVDVQNNGGNTVVICGGNSGDIDGSNVSAGGDLMFGSGGAP